MLKKVRRYYLFVIGCQMNVSDAERLAAKLKKLGYQAASQEKDADLIIAVACSVRQIAIDRVFGRAVQWRELKRKNPHLKILVTGCVLPDDRPKFDKLFDGYFDIKRLDTFVIPAEAYSVCEANGLNKAGIQQNSLKASFPGFPTRLQARQVKSGMTGQSGTLDCGYLKMSPHYNSKFQAFVPIMTGCNNFCTYCAVPLTRGREVSRPFNEIIKEVRALIKNDYKEITLLGQNVNNYGQPWTLPASRSRTSTWLSFSQLLEEIAKLPGDFWLRFLTSNPWNFNEDIIKVMARYSNKIAPYVHLPIQSGNNAVLKRMNRRHTVEQYKTLIKKLRAAIPGLAISTDIIVGFSGETKKQFEETAKLMRWAKYDMAFLAKYSPRRGTLAAKKWKDNVSPSEKTRRFNILNKILAESALKNNKKYLDRKARVLVESYDKRTGRLSGRTDTFKLTHFAGPQKLVGQFVDVIIKEVGPWWLKGVLV